MTRDADELPPELQVLADVALRVAEERRQERATRPDSKGGTEQ